MLSPAGERDAGSLSEFYFNKRANSMNSKSERDVEKTYSLPDFIAKLRRLADALEQGERFEIQIAGERISVPARANCNIEHEREGASEEIEFQIKWENPQ